MTEFGKQLRTFRQRCNDPQSPQGKLTQERFGELVGRELGISYTGAAVSDWERGKTRIQASNRPVLMAAVKVLYKNGGLSTIKEANQLLKAGKYSDLDSEEAEKIFKDPGGNTVLERSGPETKKSTWSIPVLISGLFSMSEAEVQDLIASSQAGPPPAWPRVLAGLMRFVADRLSFSLTDILWIGVWLVGWWALVPSLRWPFITREAAYSAMVLYIGGTLVIPLLIGSLVNTGSNKYWQQQGFANSFLLRLYTYQGAGIGLNLGYFFVFPLVLGRYYLGLGPSIWLEFAAVTAGLILGNMSARVVPHNLWLAYGRLKLSDGWIFFVAALVGPLWGIFFLEYYSILLTPILGSIVILLALTGTVVFGMYQSRKKPDR